MIDFVKQREDILKTEEMEPIKPGNPFLSDSVHMGERLGTNVCVMFMRFPDEYHDYLIVVNTRTGQRLKVKLTDDEG